MRTLILTSLLFLLAGNLFAQTGPMTNEDVKGMVVAGVPESVIITKIKTSPVNFQTDTASLKALTEAKVPEAVMSAMIERSSQDGQTPSSVRKAVSSPYFIPYSQLNKSQQKERLKSPVRIDIAAASQDVQDLLIRAFQDHGYRIENNGNNNFSPVARYLNSIRSRHLEN